MASASDEFLALPGAPAHSLFRLAELRDRLNRSLAATNAPGRESRVVDIRSIHVHYICPQDSATKAVLRDAGAAERRSLDLMLAYGDASSELKSDAETESLVKVVNGEVAQDGKPRLLLYVVPRKGTVSPWSSKATSIAHVCGLDKAVRRIERGVLYSLVFDGEYAHGGGAYPSANHLYDRMTQVTVFSQAIL